MHTSAALCCLLAVKSHCYTVALLLVFSTVAASTVLLRLSLNGLQLLLLLLMLGVLLLLMLLALCSQQALNAASAGSYRCSESPNKLRHIHYARTLTHFSEPSPVICPWPAMDLHAVPE